MHMRFVAELYHKQLEGNGHILTNIHDTPRHGSQIARPSCPSCQALRSFAGTNASMELLRLTARTQDGQ